MLKSTHTIIHLRIHKRYLPYFEVTDLRWNKIGQWCLWKRCEWSRSIHRSVGVLYVNPVRLIKTHTNNRRSIKFYIVQPVQSVSVQLIIKLSWRHGSRHSVKEWLQTSERCRLTHDRIHYGIRTHIVRIPEETTLLKWVQFTEDVLLYFFRLSVNNILRCINGFSFHIFSNGVYGLGCFVKCISSGYLNTIYTTLDYGCKIFIVKFTSFVTEIIETVVEKILRPLCFRVYGSI